MPAQHIHIVGICGTFMGGLAQLAQSQGYFVSGCDENIYPPMSDQLRQAGIELMEGYKPEHISHCNNGSGPDCVVVGNALSRGNALIEALLDSGLPYSSGPQWLAEHVLRDRWVLAVAGTHGKTTTSSMLAWILAQAGLQPGFLIGGVPNNFGVSARLGESPFFVIEADEYDTAFFDKRSKFIHYHPRTLILNNLEYDHADIFSDLDAIKRQFHFLLRTVPPSGRVISNAEDVNLVDVLAQGCWSETETFGGIASGALWQLELSADSEPTVRLDSTDLPVGGWPIVGEHNMLNALAAIAAARHVGVKPDDAIRALHNFAGIKRRLELLDSVNGVSIYDDFAHHPTAIAATLAALNETKSEGARVFAVLELRSNTMRMGVHDALLPSALAAADCAWVYQAQDSSALHNAAQEDLILNQSLEEIIDDIRQRVRGKDRVVIMSNGGFGGLRAKLVQALQHDSG